MANWPSEVRRFVSGRSPRLARVLGPALLAAGAWLAVRPGGLGLGLLAWGSEGGGEVVAVAAAPSQRMPGGALVICGGGRLPERVRDRFVELAGGRDARVVVISTAHSYADRAERAGPLLDPWKARGVASARLFHTRSRADANDPTFVRPLAEATGVWISGGSQARLTEVYLGTEVERQLKALLDRGGVIGGTSAGAAVMSRVMIASGRTEARLGEGFGLLPGTVIDQHFLKRNRMTRLSNAVRTRPDLLGLGIDEGTAVVVDVRGGRLTVLGDSYVVSCVARPPAPAPAAQSPSPSPTPDAPRAGLASVPATGPKPPMAGAPDPQPGTHVNFLKAGDEADLRALLEGAPHAVATSIDFDAL